MAQDAAQAPAEDIDATLRRTDPDRWLSSRLIADAGARADVVALYAFDGELARAVVGRKEPLAAEIRLTWWLEAVGKLFDGAGAGGHPVLQALDGAIQRHGLSRAPLEAMVEARYALLEPGPCPDRAALEAFVDGTEGAVMALAIAVLARADAQGVRPAAQALGLTRLVRLDAERLPADWPADAALAQARVLFNESRPALSALPVEAFPAVAHLTLLRAYLAGREPPGLERRLRITWAALTGGV